MTQGPGSVSKRLHPDALAKSYGGLGEGTAQAEIDEAVGAALAWACVTAAARHEPS